MIGALYETSLAGANAVEVEREDGSCYPLHAQRWFSALPGDHSLLDRCAGPTLDIGSGPGRLTVALAARGHPALGIDVTQHAVELTRRAGGSALHRDVFGRVPGAGRWRWALLADGNVGIGGDPASLLRRVTDLLGPGGTALVEVDVPGLPTGQEWLRLRDGDQRGPWFSWARVSVDDVDTIAAGCGFTVTERWTEGGRWFVALTRQ